jgi:hypothetical protein
MKSSQERKEAVNIATAPLIERIGQLEKDALAAKAAGESARATKLEKDAEEIRAQRDRIMTEYVGVSVSEAAAKAKVEDVGDFRQLEREAGRNDGLAEGRRETIDVLKGALERRDSLVESAVKTSQPAPASAPVAAPAPTSVVVNNNTSQGVISAGNGIYIVEGRPCRLVGGQYVLCSGADRVWRMNGGSKEYWNGSAWGGGVISAPTATIHSGHRRPACVHGWTEAGHEGCGCFGVRGGAGVHLNILGLIKFGAGGGAGVGGH